MKALILFGPSNYGCEPSIVLGPFETVKAAVDKGWRWALERHVVEHVHKGVNDTWYEGRPGEGKGDPMFSVVPFVDERG